MTSQDFFNAGLQMIINCWCIGIGFGLAASVFRRAVK